MEVRSGVRLERCDNARASWTGTGAAIKDREVHRNIAGISYCGIGTDRHISSKVVCVPCTGYHCFVYNSYSFLLHPQLDQF